MKGVITLALKEMVIQNFGIEKWQEALKMVGIDSEPFIMPISNLEDQLVLRIIQSLCEILEVSLSQAADLFGEYWMKNYAPKMYSAYFSGKESARDFLLAMDKVHVETTKLINDARPPRFEFEWRDDKTLIMKYISKRDLIDFMVGLIKGVGSYYEENLQVKKLSHDEVMIVFP
ncbi:heme NO-binding domain-containing protein [candidate division CSSED10-310 bacterium]|uniref:Heme NO-binding domain-containing protein n=1 Tax=candidate division CSSED10-310 bacterium TaxID=2855610 RepID=A0ABV6Z2L9_UNCC1